MLQRERCVPLRGSTLFGGSTNQLRRVARVKDALDNEGSRPSQNRTSRQVSSLTKFSCHFPLGSAHK
ncbi:MAG: hypothetical protein DME26_03480 [Verrucomicrobia bacterium]|nr:MAG: hypothetical protein DME26_03480 [Verrucomicrobiota bacterium]